MARRLDTCPACRALLEPGTPVCPYCETRLRVRRRGAWGALVGLYARAPASSTLFLVILALFSAELWMIQRLGGEGATSLALARLGANVGDLNVRGGEAWRFATAIFLHVGFVHLLFNGWGLFQLAPFCERIYGASRFLAVYLVSGLVGNVVSYLLFVELRDVPAVRFVVQDILRMEGGHWLQAGASGSLCGLVGLLMVFRTGDGWDVEAQAIRRMTAQWLFYIVLFGIFVGADNLAHLGGAATGAGMGLLLGHRSIRTGRAWTRIAWRPAAAVLILAMLAAFGAMVASQGPWREAERLLALGQAYERLQEALDADASLRGAMEARAALRVAHADFAAAPAGGPLAAARDGVAEAVGRRLDGPPPAADVPLLRARARFTEAYAEAVHRERTRLSLIVSVAKPGPR
jgi:rhomboid protease GluP